ncbi:MAG: 50S ribosomal protein L32 [Bacteroidales bacterium]|nr:50S ribosomal protein L32 [Bacteroidales bacterium]NLM92823.1 50S ribosomal protein L32 [Bacteroidales bacterium]
MAHPKSKISKTRRDKRRTHYKATEPALTTCPNCGAARLMHRVCPECGHYRGQLAIEKSAKA